MLVQEVEKEQGVIAASPSIYGQVMLTSGPRVSGVVVRGIDPDRINKVVDIGRYIKQGTLQNLKQQQGAIDAYYQASPWLVTGLFVLVYVVLTAVSFPGATILTLAAGAIFVWWRVR